MNRSSIRVMLVAAIMGCVGLSAIGQAKSKPSIAAVKPAAPTSYTVKPQDFKIELKVSGILESMNTEEISVKPEVWKSFKVVEAAKQGIKVNAGDVLVKFDTEDYEEALKNSERDERLSQIAYEQAKLEYEQAQISTKESIEDTKRAAKQAEEDYQYYKDVERKNTIRSYKESYISSLKRLEAAQEELNQLKKMYEEDDLTEETEEIILKRHERAVELAKFSAERAKLYYERTMSTTFPRSEASKERSFERRARSTKYTLKSIPLSIESKELGMEKTNIGREKAEEKFDNLKKDAEWFTVKAPVTGILYYGKASKGQWSGLVASRLKKDGAIQPKEVFMTIVDTKDVQVQSSVAESQLYLANPGIKGVAKVAAYPDARLPVTLKTVNRIPTGGGKFAVTLEVDHANATKADNVLPGYSISATLVAYHKKDALTVPSSMVHTEKDSDSQYVFVKGKDGKVAKTTVTTGLSHGGKTEVKSGVKAGDQIVPKGK